MKHDSLPIHKKLILVGIPFDHFSTYAKGAALAPEQIRKALRCESTNWCSESGIDLSDVELLQDIGDLILSTDPNSGYSEIQVEMEKLLDGDVAILALGGDHSVTFPVVKAHAKKHSPLNILHCDAHPDLYEKFEGNPYSHACPFARIMEQGLAKRLVQVGIRTSTPHQRDQAARFGVETIEVRDLNAALQLNFDGPLYLSIDLDVLDPAFAPGVSHWEPGGLNTRDLITLIQELDAPIIGADVVELNPNRDPQGITAMVAAKLVKELAAKMLSKH